MTDPRAEFAAKLAEAMMNEAPWRDQMWARCALASAARTIRRGRLLTEAEKLENLAKAAEEDVSACETAEESEGMLKFAELLRSKITSA